MVCWVSGGLGDSEGLDFTVIVWDGSLVGPKKTKEISTKVAPDINNICLRGHRQERQSHGGAPCVIVIWFGSSAKARLAAASLLTVARGYAVFGSLTSMPSVAGARRASSLGLP